MLNPDDIIESGFSSLRNAISSVAPAELIAKDRRRQARARLRRSAAAVAGCTVIAAVAAVILQPTSALAALRESARLTSAQPVLHLRAETISSTPASSLKPWPPKPILDIWKLPGYYVRKEGHILSKLSQNGQTLSYDDRFPTGFKSTYDAKMDQFWTFDGSIGVELRGPHREPPTVQTVVEKGRTYNKYTWHDEDQMGRKTTIGIYVDTETRLVSFGLSSMTSADGSTSSSQTSVDYPQKASAERQLPKFPADLKFKTFDQLADEFDRAISRPDQTKEFKGVKVTLYGIVAGPNVPDGISVTVISKGGVAPDYGSGEGPEVIGSQMIGAKRLEWFPPMTDPAHTRLCDEQRIDGHNYLVGTSNDLLKVAPTKITVRVPVWKLNAQTKAHDFLGYVSFTTTKIFLQPSDMGWNLYGPGRAK